MSNQATGVTTTTTAHSGDSVTPGVKFIIEITLFLTYVLFAVAWQAGDHYIRSLGFTTSQAALLTNAVSLAQAIGSLAAANILLRMGAKNAFTLASLLIVFGGSLSFFTAYPIVFLIRFVLGLGGALAVVYLSAIVARLFTGKPLQIANGVNSVAFNTGLAIALTLAAQKANNPVAAVLITATLSIIVLIVWLIFARFVPKVTATESATDASYTMRNGFSEWFNWVFALAYTGLLSYYIVAFTFMDPNTIRWVVYAGVIGAVTGTLTAARVPEQLKPVIVVVSAALQLVFAALVLTLANTQYEITVSVILGLVIFFPMPFFVQMAFMRPGVTPRQISVTFSIFWAVSYAFSVILVQIFAWITDLTGGLAENNTPVSAIPLIYIIFVEGTFLIGTIMLMVHLKKVRAAAQVQS